MKPLTFALVIIVFFLFAADGFATENKELTAVEQLGLLAQPAPEATYYEQKVINAQKYLREVSAEIDANMMWADQADYERNQY